MLKKFLGIYVHVPFCNGKCPYCNFYSIAPNESIIKRYIDAVCEKIISWSGLLDHTVDTIYFGGGTPSAIDSDFISRVMDCIGKSFKTDLKEATIEINPSNYNSVNFANLKFSGINRVSIGAQSLVKDELVTLGRRHSAQDVLSSIEICRKYGINNISLDLMIGTPSQKKENLIKSIDFCLENNIPHISAYLLKVEKNTPYFKMKDSLAFLSDESQADLYELMCEKLKSNNYSHYEISNFCIESFESLHNLKYWQCDDYLGIGPSAHSFINGKRFFYSNSLDDFVNGKDIIEDGTGGSIEEYSMLALRLSSGLNNDSFYKKFNIDIPAKYFKRAEILSRHGLVTCTDNEIKLTDKGFLLSNSIILNIIY